MKPTELKIARLRAGLNQQDVADKMGIHVNTYGLMERHPDRMSIGEAKRFSEIVDIPVEDLFFDTNSN